MIVTVPSFDSIAPDNLGGLTLHLPLCPVGHYLHKIQVISENNDCILGQAIATHIPYMDKTLNSPSIFFKFIVNIDDDACLTNLALQQVIDGTEVCFVETVILQDVTGKVLNALETACILQQVLIQHNQLIPDCFLHQLTRELKLCPNKA